MKNKIIELLEVTTSYYEDVLLQTYIDWCGAFCKDKGSLQQALSSKALQKYFKAHYLILEEQFLTEMCNYKALDKATKADYYAKITNKIFNSYPGALAPKLTPKQSKLCLN